MSEHQGVIALDNQTIQVTLGINDIEVHLTTDDAEVGTWTHDECHIVANGAGTFFIEAENDALPFIPHDAARFAQVLVATIPKDAPTQVGKEVVPPPRPVTLALFYAVSAVTIGLGLWALWSIIF